VTGRRSTSIDWLKGAELPGNWVETKVKYLAPGMRAGETITAEDIEETGSFPVYGGNGLRGYTEAHTHSGTRLLIGRQGALCGNVHLVSGDFWASEHAIVAQSAADVDPRWLAHLLRVMNLGQYSQTSAQPGIGTSQINALAAPLPSSEEQRAIADYLDHETAQIDTLMVEQERLIEIQRERRDAVIDRGVFGLDVAGDETRNLGLIGRHRAIEPLLGAIPGSWRVERFKAALDRLDERNVDLSFPMMSLKSTGDVVPRSSTGERQEPDETSLPRYLVAHVDDLVVNPMWLIGGAIGVSGVDGAVSPDYRVFRSTGEHHPRYLHHLLRSRPYRDQYVLYTRAQTTFDRRVQQPDLDNMPLPVPPLTEQAAIAERIDRTIFKIDAMIAETQALITLAKERRTALITAAVTGQIDVRSAAA